MRVLHRSLAAVVGGMAALGLMASVASAQVFPTGAHAGYNFLPFGVNQTATYHQVYLSSLFGGSPVEISEIGFATNPARQGQQADMDVVIRMGYTSRAPGGLSPTLSENPSGSLTEVYRITNRLHTNASPDPNTFDLVFALDTPFNYNPGQNNLLIEIEVTSRVVNGDVSISTNGDGTESSRAWNSTRFAPNADLSAARTNFVMGPGGGNCSDFAITQGGSCPGPMTLSWTGAPSGVTKRIIYTSSGGSGGVIPPGNPCAGTTICIGLAGVTLHPNSLPGTANGTSPSFNAPCGTRVQLIGQGSCETSNALVLQ